jgi:hypothetical protein
MYESQCILIFYWYIAQVLDYKSSPLIGQILGLGAQFNAVFDCVGDQALYQSSPTFLVPSGSYLALSPDLGGIDGVWKAAQKIASFLSNYWLPVWAGGVPRKYQFRSTKITKTEMLKVAQIYEDGKIHTYEIVICDITIMRTSLGHIQVLVDSVYASDKPSILNAYDRVSSMKVVILIFYFKLYPFRRLINCHTG